MRSTLISGLFLAGFVALVAPIARLRFDSRAQTLPPPNTLPPLPAQSIPPLPSRVIAPAQAQFTTPGGLEQAGLSIPAPIVKSSAPGVAPTQLPGSGWASRLEKDHANLPPLTRQMLFTLRRGADWLSRMNGVKGTFSPGVSPAVREEVIDEGLLRQLSAAWALGRAAQALGDAKYEARALQALLCALEDSMVDPADPQCRYTSVPQVLVPRLQGTAMMALAIVEQPNPPSDMVDQAEQMVNYIRKHAFDEKTLQSSHHANLNQADCASSPRYLMAYTLLRSHKVRPSAWKPELARQCVGVTQGTVTVAEQPWQGLALAELSRTTGDREATNRLYTLCEELMRWQQVRLDPAHPRFLGGFQPPATGPTTPGQSNQPPNTSTCAAILITLAEGAILAREQGDSPRNQALMEAVDRSTQYLAQQQYTEATAQHFAEWYRPLLEGGFRETEQDGNLRLFTQHLALAGLQQALRASAP